MTFDLDAALVEHGRAPLTIRFAGEDWILPADMPIDTIRLWQQIAAKDDDAGADPAQFATAARAMLGPAADGLLAAGLGVQGFTMIVDALAEHIGVTAGESSASSTS